MNVRSRRLFTRDWLAHRRFLLQAERASTPPLQLQTVRTPSPSKKTELNNAVRTRFLFFKYMLCLKRRIHSCFLVQIKRAPTPPELPKQVTRVSQKQVRAFCIIPYVTDRGHAFSLTVCICQRKPIDVLILIFFILYLSVYVSLLCFQLRLASNDDHGVVWCSWRREHPLLRSFRTD